jgi:hypothetical protein
MVLGPADEFVVIGTSQLHVPTPEGWQARPVERTVLATGTSKEGRTREVV